MKRGKRLILPAGADNIEPLSHAKKLRREPLEGIDNIIIPNSSSHLHLVFLIAATTL